MRIAGEVEPRRAVLTFEILRADEAVCRDGVDYRHHAVILLGQTVDVLAAFGLCLMRRGDGMVHLRHLARVNLLEGRQQVDTYDCSSYAAGSDDVGADQPPVGLAITDDVSGRCILRLGGV